MDAAHLSRLARRRLGMSQRELAAATGVTRSHINAIERGAKVPSTAFVTRLLQAADLDLVPSERVAEPDREELIAHLQRSLTQRLRLALGIPIDLRAPATDPAWLELKALTKVGQVVLEPPLAHRLWLPTGPAAPVRVRIHQPRGDLPPLHAVTATVTPAPRPATFVPVVLAWVHRVWVAPPAELALDPIADRLRLADRLLHDEAARDDARRRRPAHRDPDEFAEGWRLERTKGSERILIPDGTYSRAWRLGAPASLAQLLGPDARLLE